MPKAAPRADRRGAGTQGAAPVYGLRGTPVDIEGRMQAGEGGGSSSPRDLARERMERRASDAGAVMGRAKARARELRPE